MTSSTLPRVLSLAILILLAPRRAAAAPADMVISEIHYHPASECEEEEFIELFNAGGEDVDLAGWSFAGGVPFVFPAGTVAHPGEYIVVARSPAALQAAFGKVARIYGPWGAWPGHDGQASLSNDGEDIDLVDASGAPVNRVSYDDKVPWPISPDGGGPSLELISPSLPIDTAGNWRAAGATGPRWTFHRATGKAGGSTLRLTLSAPGAYLVDDVALEPAGGGANLVANGGFEEDGGWTFAGSHAGSARAIGEAHTGAACLRIEATAAGGLADAVLQSIPGLVPGGPSYTLAFWAKRVEPGPSLRAGFEGGAVSFERSEDIPAGLSPAGSSIHDPSTGTFIVRGAGNDVWGSTDEFHYVHAPLEGDGAIEAEVRWTDGPNDWGKAGLMIRETTSPGSKHAMAILSRDYGLRLQFRSGTGGESSDIAGPDVRGPVRIRLRRQGSTFIAEADTGGGLREYARAEIAMVSPARIGLMVLSHQGGALGMAAFKGVVSSSVGLQAATPAGDDPVAAIATPGAPNTQLSDGVPPFIRKAGHSPAEPSSSDEVTITAKVESPDPLGEIASVVLETQDVLPGKYIRLTDAEYRSGWSAAAMRDDGAGGDAKAGDGTWSARLPAKPNRTLVRYRIRATDTRGLVTRFPGDDDPSPNFGCFVYDGVPDYVADTRSAHGPVPHVHPAAGFEPIPVYHLITTDGDFTECWGNQGQDFNDNTFRWRGTFVFRGAVYDHLQYRLRGGVWRYVYPKRYFKLRFLDGHHFEGVDDLGTAYPRKRAKLNLNSAIGNPAAGLGIRGECGIYETLAFSLFRWMGVPSPQTSWVQLRAVRGEDEAGADQYGGDFLGIYLDIEQPDSRFLEARGLPPGNLYKMESGWDKEVNGCRPADDSDIRTFTSRMNGNYDWVLSNIDTAEYVSYHAVVQMAQHYDISWGKNYYYYHHPLNDWWLMLPWDTDLTFNANYGGDGSDPFTSAVLRSNPDTFGLDFKNRLREGMDLMFREERLVPLIDAWQALIEKLVRADRDRWDDGSISPFASLPQRMTELKGWIRSRMAFLQGLCADTTIPATPSIESPAPRAKLAPGGLTFASSAFSGSAGRSHAATRWIATRVSAWSGEGSVERTELIPLGEVWRFFRGTAEPPGAALEWTRGGYDEGSWETGGLGIGYGDGAADVTILSDMRDKYSTVYIRKEFTVDDPAAFTGIDLTVDYDDGFIAYLNGTPVARARAPAGSPVAHDVPASATHEVNGGETFRLDGSPAGLLVKGTNVLALQGFNVKNSSDFTLNAGLTGVSGEEPPGPAVPLASLLAENELSPRWDSDLVSPEETTIRIPAGAVDPTPGTIYRVRVRHLDDAGRWSHWSKPVEVEIAPAPVQAFRRGDANADGGVDLADAVRLLFHLFAGGAGPACERAADANGSGALDVSDAIALLAYLFTGGAPPAQPFPACGTLAAPDALTCGSYPPCR